MKVLHFGTLVASQGGPAMSTYWALYGLRQQGVDAEIIMFPLREGDVLRGEEVPVHYVQSVPHTPLAYASSCKRDIQNAGVFDIYHAQGVWLWSTYALVDVAKKLGKPYLITPRGMLYPQDIAKHNKGFKKLSLKWRLLDDLNHAACVHVTCKDEMMHCRNLGITSPMAIIPNPVEIKDYPYKKEDNKFRLGYLGRLSLRKNVEALIYAFADMGEMAADAELLIIGGGDDKYEKFLKDKVLELGLKNVVFAGFLNGEEKDKALASCSVLAMPSEFENLGNVILEGLVRRIPCIATTGAPWEELNTEHCGWQVPYTQKDITDAVRKAMCTSTEELSLMGENGRRLMERKYSVEAVAKDLKVVYQWILGKGEKPEFVYEGKKSDVNAKTAFVKELHQGKLFV